LGNRAVDLPDNVAGVYVFEMVSRRRSATRCTLTLVLPFHGSQWNGGIDKFTTVLER